MKFSITIDFDGKVFDIWSQEKDTLTKKERVIYDAMLRLIKSTVKAANVNPKEPLTLLFKE